MKGKMFLIWMRHKDDDNDDEVGEEERERGIMKWARLRCFSYPTMQDKSPLSNSWTRDLMLNCSSRRS